MEKKGKTWMNIIGLTVFLLALPLFFRMGGGRIVLAEVLPGQAAAGGLSLSALFEKREKTLVSANIETIGVDDVEFSESLAVSAGGRPLNVTAEELGKMEDLSYLRSNYYIVDSRTTLLSEDIDVEAALGLDLTVEKTAKVRQRGRMNGWSRTFERFWRNIRPSKSVSISIGMGCLRGRNW